MHTSDNGSAAAQVAALCARFDHDPGYTLQILWRIQDRYGHIPPALRGQVARTLGLGLHSVTAVIEFYSFLHLEPRGDYDILVSDNITDQMLGSRTLASRLCRRLGVERGRPRADGRVTVDFTSCTGMPDQGPAALINGITLTRLDPTRVDTLAQLVEERVPVVEWPAEFFEVRDNIRRPDTLLAPVEDGAGLRRGLDLSPEQLIATVSDSRLRGRGGAGFPTGTKWRLCAQTPSDIRYVVCNADEGEPGTFKDRVLLQSHADRVFEGMSLCAYAIGARRGYLYLRGEYRYLLDALEATLQHRREVGLLGRDILGREGFEFDIEIHLGAGAYICGEESALIESLEGRRGIPRIRPPFPVTHGYRGRPTVVNNVETFAAVTKIAAHGAEWFRAQGTPESSGTKLLSISGDCKRPGVYEYPWGITLRQVLADCGADDTQAVQVAGPAGQCLSPEAFDRRFAFEDIATGGSLMVFDTRRDILDAVHNFADFFVHESCGFCTPCRVGTALMRDLIKKVHTGHGTQYDLDQLKRLAEVTRSTAHCGLGHTAPNPILDTLRSFPENYTARLRPDDYAPAFDLDGALEAARRLTGRNDAYAHLREDT